MTRLAVCLALILLRRRYQTLARRADGPFDSLLSLQLTRVEVAVEALESLR